MTKEDIKAIELEAKTNARLELALREKSALEKAGIPSPFAEVEILRIENKRLLSIIRKIKLLVDEPVGQNGWDGE